MMEPDDLLAIMAAILYQRSSSTAHAASMAVSDAEAILQAVRARGGPKTAESPQIAPRAFLGALR